MKKSFFHGTSADNLKNILKNGFDPYQSKIWTVSENGIYFWSPDKLVEYKNCEEDNKIEYSIQMAYDSATCALAKSKDCRAVVFEVEIDDEEFCEDTSCPNMEGAVVIFDEVPASCIKKIWISEDLSLFRGQFIGSMMNRNLNNIEFSDVERKIGEMFKNSDFYIYVNEEFPLKPYKFRRIEK